jgi:hypothetical protein
MVQQIHAQHVAAANNGGKVDQVIGVVGEALQVAQVVGAAVSALSPDVSAPGISAAPAVNAEPAAQNAQVAQPSTHG